MQWEDIKRLILSAENGDASALLMIGESITNHREEDEYVLSQDISDGWMILSASANKGCERARELLAENNIDVQEYSVDKKILNSLLRNIYLNVAKQNAINKSYYSGTIQSSSRTVIEPRDNHFDDVMSRAGSSVGRFVGGIILFALIIFVVAGVAGLLWFGIKQLI